MHILCDNCNIPADVNSITVEPYVETTVPHLGIVREWYICKECTEEKRLWAVDSGSEQAYNERHDNHS